ncbi:DAPG hydrolase family protein [Nocardia sp. NPDC004123]
MGEEFRDDGHVPRYKLWHPDAHLFASLEVDKTAEAIPDRAKYVGNISYVDEYVGPKLQQLAIAFQEPTAHGFDVPDGHTLIFGRVGSSVLPLDVGWLAHQVRPIPGGCEMRSRFYLNLLGLHTPNLAQAAAAVQRGAATDLDVGVDLARELLMHCGQEMHHLSTFLPDLHREFGS